MHTRKTKSIAIAICLILATTLANWIYFANATDMFNAPYELATRRGGNLAASYNSPNGEYRADVYLYPEQSLSLPALRLRIVDTQNEAHSWNIAYIYGYELSKTKYGETYQELSWIDDKTISINGIILDIFHMTYIS